MTLPIPDLRPAAVSRVSRRLIPFLLLLYILNFLDRVNVGFAALEMNRDLNFGPAVYGLGAGIFFLGYCLFEVPSNLVLYRIGARVWIARIMVTWGLAASAMMLVRTPASFYLLRFLLGVAEAGFFPGIIYYLTHWYPARERARAYAWFLSAIPVCGVIGGPVSGALLGLDGRLGLQGWQWLFLLEGIPSIVVGIVVLRLLPNRPREARWIPAEERAWLEVQVEAERVSVPSHGESLRRTLGNPQVWWLSLSYFLLLVALYGFALWLPQLVKASGIFSNFEVGVITAIPYAVAAVGDAAGGPELGPKRRAVSPPRTARTRRRPGVPRGDAGRGARRSWSRRCRSSHSACSGGWGRSGRCRPPSCGSRRRPAASR